MKLLTLSLSALFILNLSAAFGAPLALIYKGPGSCIEGCSESPASILQSMGYETKFVGPDEVDFEIFKGASLWLQPGGSVRAQYKAMNPALKENIVKFVAEGGSYVGICAGALLASEGYYWESKDGVFTEKGFNFFSGYSTIYQSGMDENQNYINADIIPTMWEGVLRYLYWEEGPVFFYHKKWKEDNVEVISTYPNNFPASLRRKYLKGKVIVTAFHPEAISEWLAYYGLTEKDKDSSDFDLLKSMVKWTESSL